tara:strand:- start:297 stop:671 length:375 start_codon:yes stop_codon:yes gene_type:complete
MDLQDQAQEFRHCYGIINSCNKRDNQMMLIKEEFEEFIDAHITMFDAASGEADCLKELADLVYVCFQYAENMEWDLNEAMARVHESNMSKLDENGKPIRNDNGKVLKGPNYRPPVLDDLVHLIC